MAMLNSAATDMLMVHLDKVRTKGRATRRVYVTRAEYVALIMDMPGILSTDAARGGVVMFDTAYIRQSKVAPLIREWDEAPCPT